MLATEKNTSTVERRIRSSFRAEFHKQSFETVFEHGQWWVLLKDEEGDTTFYSVYDTADGFGFEEIG